MFKSTTKIVALILLGSSFCSSTHGMHYVKTGIAVIKQHPKKAFAATALSCALGFYIHKKTRTPISTRYSTFDATLASYKEAKKELRKFFKDKDTLAQLEAYKQKEKINPTPLIHQFIQCYTDFIQHALLVKAQQSKAELKFISAVQKARAAWGADPLVINISKTSRTHAAHYDHNSSEEQEIKRLLAIRAVFEGHKLLKK